VAVLSDNDRFAVWAELMQRLSDEHATVNLTKVQLRAAINAADQWAEDNASAYNTALPTAARNNLSTPQKAMVLMFVVARRHLVA
jgi:hypothetical protein